MVLPTGLPENLERLWNFASDAPIVAWPESSGCFNGGFFLFRPNVERRKDYNLLLSKARRVAKCDRGAVTDQSYLNAVYAGTHWLLKNGSRRRERGYVPLNFLTWRMRNSYGSGRWDACFKTPSELVKATDSFHFFDRMAPWGPNCTLDGLQGGIPCNTAVLRAHRVHGECTGHSAAQALWYTELQRLPRNVRQPCVRRLQQADGVRYY